MKKNYLQLVTNKTENIYQLIIDNEIYPLYYDEKIYEYPIDAVDYGYSLFCNYLCERKEVLVEKISFLRGIDLIENVEIVLTDGKEYEPFTKDIMINFGYFRIAYKNGKLFILNSLWLRWDEWLNAIDIRTYAKLFSEKLNMSEHIQKSKSYIEDSVQYIIFIFEFDANKTIDACINEITLLFNNIHNEILSSDNNNDSLISRFLEFEPQYYQAGLGILNYFGTIVREKYPNKNVKVKIEQNGFSVAMTIETEDGDREVIEKLLQDYSLVVLGEKVPESLLDTAVQVLELKCELMSAQGKIDMQRELLHFKDKELMDLKNLFKYALTQNTTHAHHINISPSIVIDTKQSIETKIVNNISELLVPLDNIVNMCDDKVLKSYMKDLYDEIQKMEKIEDKNSVQKSSGLSKIREFIEDANKTGNSLNTFFKSASKAYENLQAVGKKYNAIAEWCGAPQVPTVFL